MNIYKFIIFHTKTSRKIKYKVCSVLKRYRLRIYRYNSSGRVIKITKAYFLENNFIFDSDADSCSIYRMPAFHKPMIKHGISIWIIKERKASRMKCLSRSVKISATLPNTYPTQRNRKDQMNDVINWMRMKRANGTVRNPNTTSVEWFRP